MHYRHWYWKWIVCNQFSPFFINLFKSFSFYNISTYKVECQADSALFSLFFSSARAMARQTCMRSPMWSAAAASLDITFQISCIRYPAWISDSRNNFCQFDWLSDENCQVVEIINAFVSSKYLLLNSFLQLYWRTRSFLRSAHWHWHVKSSTGTL